MQVSRLLLVAALIAGASHEPSAQGEASPEYRVKAEYLVNLIKYVEWPDAVSGPLLVCVAGQNPFGTTLDNFVRNETFRGAPVQARVILEPDPACNLVFAPRTSNVRAYLRAAAGMPVLTVGETPRFLEQGGMIRFYPDGAHVRFDINRDAAERVGLRINARLLELARMARPDFNER
jgi:hypothetical protein